MIITVAVEWHSFKRLMFPKATGLQEQECRRSFYAGVISGLSLLELARKGQNNLDFMFVVQRLQTECMVFAKLEAEEQAAKREGVADGAVADEPGNTSPFPGVPQEGAEVPGRPAADGAGDVPADDSAAGLPAEAPEREPESEGLGGRGDA